MLPLRTRLMWLAAAVASFHLAYACSWLGLMMVLYLFALMQLAFAPTARQAFYLGLSAGFFTAGPQLVCFWIIFGPSAIALWLVLAFWIGLFVALARLCFLSFGRVGLALLAPFLWTGLEYFRSELYYLRFSWLNVGYALSGGFFLPLVSAFGLYGCGFVAAVVASAAQAFRKKWAACLVLAVFPLAVTSSFLLADPPHRHSSGTVNAGPTVAGVQLEFPTEPEVVQSLDHLLVAYTNADLFVLSEYTFQGPVPKSVLSWCRQHQKYLIAGGKEPAPNSDFYNTAFVVGPSGDIVFRQVKSVPVQFLKDGIPAPEQKVWNSPWGKIGLCLCYDLSYTRVTDQLIRLGAQVIIVPTMDVADWGQREHELHALVAPVRAAEYGIPIFRTASSGISQMTDKSGRVLASAPYPGQGEMFGGQLAIAGPGSIPCDRYLAPLCVAVTVLFAGGLLLKRVFRLSPPRSVRL